jgi:hypothetical protein
MRFRKILNSNQGTYHLNSCSFASKSISSEILGEGGSKPSDNYVGREHSQSSHYPKKRFVMDQLDYAPNIASYSAFQTSNSNLSV